MSPQRRGFTRSRGVNAPLYILAGLGCLALLVVVLLVGAAISMRSGQTPAVPATPMTNVVTPTGGPPSAWYQVYFTQPKNPDDGVHTGGLDGIVAASIGQARQTLDVVTFEFDSLPLADALIAAHKRGVRVRFVMDSENIDTEAYRQITTGGIPVVTDSRNAFTHSKFIVIDGQRVWTGSWNLKDSDTYRNNNNLILIESPELAANYTHEFEKMFVKRQFGPAKDSDTPYPQLTIQGTRIENYFAPQDHVADHIVQVIQKAQSSIRFLAFSFTNDQIGKAMVARAQAGVNVKGVFETRGGDTAASEYGRMKKAGLDVRLDGNPYTMHDKVIIVDESIVITGSFNFTAQADASNDENIVIIYQPDIAALYLAEFDKIYGQAKP